MSVAIQMQVNDYATPAIEKKIAKCEPRRLGSIIGRPLAEFWRNRLAGLGINKRGWPTTRFYERAARSVTNIPQDNGVLLRADHQGLRQRWLGGRISKLDKKLTIPISPISYGKRASEFPGLFLIKTPKGAYLVRYQGTSAGGFANREEPRVAKYRRSRGIAKRPKATLEFLFKLADSVNQTGNDRVVPTNDEFAEVALAQIEKEIK